MGPIDLFNHLLNFVAPALGVGFLTTLLARLALRRGTIAWWLQGAVNSAVGVAVLVAGLLIFGHDGMMATYGALVLGCGTSQWLLGGGWKA